MKKQNKYICPECGSQELIVTEIYTWGADADMDDINTINCYSPDSEVTSVICNKCGETIDFDKGGEAGDYPEFNFN